MELGVTCVFAEESRFQEVSAGRDPEPSGTGAEDAGRSGKCRNVTSPPVPCSAVILVDVSFTNNFSQCLGENLFSRNLH